MANNILQLQAGRPSDAAGGRPDYKMTHTFDLAGVATSDVLYAFKLPAGHRCKNVTLKVVTPTGLTSTAAVGIYSDIVGSAVSNNSFDASANLNAAAGTLTTGAGGTDAYVTAGGYLNLTPADTYICLTLSVTGGPIVAGSVEVVALCADET